jgi:hypothetical protein
LAKQKKQRSLAALQRDIAARAALVETGPPRPPRSAITSDAEVVDCLISGDWRTPGALVRILVARQNAGGTLMAGIALVDLGCLGVKDAFARRFSTYARYQEDLRGTADMFGPMIRVDIDLAAKIINESVAYARSLGFEPHKDLKQFESLLAGADPTAVPEQIPLGVDGQPFYISGPHDNPHRIIATLNKSVGEGNYHFMLGGPTELDGLPEPG